MGSVIVLSFIVAANSAIDKFDSLNLQSILEANFDLNLILSSFNIFNHCYFNIIVVPTTVSAVDLYFANFLSYIYLIHNQSIISFYTCICVPVQQIF